MKKVCASLLFLLVSNFAVGQVEWAPVGAKWWVFVLTDLPATSYINKYECIGTLDTLGHECKLVHEAIFDGQRFDHLFYQDGQQVYHYDETLMAFSLYHDYSKLPGESYEMVSGQGTNTFLIDSISNAIFSGENVRVQHGHISNPDFPLDLSSNKMYEGIGWYSGLWPNLPSGFTPELWYYLACYLKPDGTLLNMDPSLNVDCTALATTVNTVNEGEVGFRISPNPSAEYLNLYFENTPTATATFRIINAEGRLFREFKTANLQPTFIVPVADWPSGAYWLQMTVDGTVLQSEKFIKQ